MQDFLCSQCTIRQMNTGVTQGEVSTFLFPSFCSVRKGEVFREREREERTEEDKQ